MTKLLVYLFILALFSLFVSGSFYAAPHYALLLFDLDWDRLFSGSVLMQLHGVLSMLILILFGAIAQIHVSKRIKRSKNRTSGLLMLSLMLLLIVSGYALYYLGSIEWREVASHGHSILGCAIVLICIVHAGSNRIKSAVY